MEKWFALTSSVLEAVLSLLSVHYVSWLSYPQTIQPVPWSTMYNGSCCDNLLLDRRHINVSISLMDKLFKKKTNN